MFYGDSIQEKLQFLAQLAKILRRIGKNPLDYYVSIFIEAVELFLATPNGMYWSFDDRKSNNVISIIYVKLLNDDLTYLHELAHHFQDPEKLPSWHRFCDQFLKVYEGMTKLVLYGTLIPVANVAISLLIGDSTHLHEELRLATVSVLLSFGLVIYTAISSVYYLYGNPEEQKARSMAADHSPF